MFKPSVQKKITDALEQEGFIKEDFKTQKSRSVLTFIYKDYTGFTFSIDSENPKELVESTLFERKTKGFKVTMSPGEYKKIEIDYYSINSIRSQIYEWLLYIKEELQNKREDDSEEDNDSAEKKEVFSQKVEDYFENEVAKTNEYLSSEEVSTVEETVDHWKDQIETLLKKAHGDISDLQNEVNHMQTRLDSLKNDAKFKTKTNYAKSVFKKVGWFIIAYPAATENLLNIINELLTPLGYQNLLKGELAQVLESPVQLFLMKSEEEN